MQIKMLCIGKTGKKFLEEGEQEYLKRLRHYLNFEMLVFPDVKQTKNLTEHLIKEKEGELLLNQFSSSDLVFLLDERGKTFSSLKFADFFQDIFNKGVKTVYFVIGGPYGFSDAVYKRANGMISLSTMTFSHQMIRLFFIEQVYRAMTIMKNEPYHHA